MFLIQGVFFQNEEERKSSEKMDLHESTFHGRIFTDPIKKPQLIGRVEDHYGVSWLFDISFSEQELLFTKQYDFVHNLIKFKYQLKRQGNFYVGECMKLSPNGKICEKRAAKCFITKVPDDFFLEPQ